jgi:hypothetical protein
MMFLMDPPCLFSLPLPDILLTLQCSICGGFGICGVAENLLRCVGEKGVKYAPLAQYLSLPSELS